jgi:excisionase family DNA binding protein
MVTVMSEETSPPWLSTSEAARRIGLSADTIRRYADSGQLPVLITPSGQRRFRPEDVDALLSRKSA